MPEERSIRQPRLCRTSRAGHPGEPRPAKQPAHPGSAVPHNPGFRILDSAPGVQRSGEVPVAVVAVADDDPGVAGQHAAGVDRVRGPVPGRFRRCFRVRPRLPRERPDSRCRLLSVSRRIGNSSSRVSRLNTERIDASLGSDAASSSAMPLRVRCSCVLRLTAATSIKLYRPLHSVSLAGPPALHIVKTANGVAFAN